MKRPSWLLFLVFQLGLSVVCSQYNGRDEETRRDRFK